MDVASAVGTIPAAKSSKETLPAVPRNKVSDQRRYVLPLDSRIMKVISFIFRLPEDPGNPKGRTTFADPEVQGESSNPG